MRFAYENITNDISDVIISKNEIKKLLIEEANCIKSFKNSENIEGSDRVRSYIMNRISEASNKKCSLLVELWNNSDLAVSREEYVSYILELKSEIDKKLDIEFINTESGPLYDLSRLDERLNNKNEIINEMPSVNSIMEKSSKPKFLSGILAPFAFPSPSLKGSVSGRAVRGDKDDTPVCYSACEEAADLEVCHMEVPIEVDSQIAERMKHIEDSFAEYLLYIIDERGMENAEVYKRALVDKKTFSKLKNNPDYHPTKLTALCLCVGAMLNLDETKDLLARAGYALSPSDKTDIIFSYFIENKYYDIIEIDIKLEEYGLPCLIS